MPNLLRIWDWKFDALFTKPDQSEHGTWKEGITPGTIKAYIRVLLADKDQEHRAQLRQLKRELLQANDSSINNGTIRSAIFERITNLFSLHGIN